MQKRNRILVYKILSKTLCENAFKKEKDADLDKYC